MINFDKFIFSLLSNNGYRCITTEDISLALKDQGIIYKDGQLQRIEDVTPKSFEIRKGKYYMCIKDYWSITYETTIFTKGKVYFSDVRNHLVADNGVSFVWSTNFDDYKDIIRPATEEEISQRMESAKAKEEVYSSADLTEFEAKLKELFGITDFAARDIGKTLMGIAREEVIEKACEWFKKLDEQECSFDGIDAFIVHFREAMEKGEQL